MKRDAPGFVLATDVDLDCVHLERAYTLARGSVAIQEAKFAADDLLLSQFAQAAALYHGSFLEGFSVDDAPDFDDWVRQQRAVWQQRVSLVFDRLSQWQLDSGELATALETFATWLAHDSLNEVAHRRLIQAHGCAPCI